MIMADETSTTGPDGSKPAIPPHNPSPEPEARIIEERIITQPTKARVVAPTSLPPPSAPVPVPPPPPTPPPIPRAAPEVPPQKVEIITVPPPTPVPPTDPASQHVPANASKEQDAISKILKEVKLPERRGTPTATLASQKVFDTVLGGTAPPIPPAPAPAVSPKSESQSVPAQKEAASPASAIAPLRTLKNDLQDVVRTQKISLVRAVSLEEKRRSAPSQTTLEDVKPPSRHTFNMLFVAALFVVLGAAAFFGVFLIMGERSGTPPSGVQGSILFAESTVPLPLGATTPIELKRLLAQARQNSNSTLGSITRITPTIAGTDAEGNATERPATLQEFMQALGVRASPDLYRALSDEFFFGLHTVDENAPLFIIPVLSYERAFAATLRWEETLNADFSPAFTPVTDQMVGASGLPEKRRFNDLVMRNYDVRALKDDVGTIEMYYSFPTRAYLVIAESPYSFTEILSRLRAERKL